MIIINAKLLKQSTKRITSAIALSLVMLFLFTNVVFADSTNLNEFKQEVYKNMVDRQTSFTIKYTGNTTELIDKSNVVVKEAYSIDDYLKWSWSGMSWKISGYTNNANVTFTASYHTTKEQEVMIDTKIDEILAKIITPEMSQKAKVKAIHDYVIANVKYDDTLQKRSAYTALFEGEAVCQGYALLLDKMLEKAGIQSIIVTGSIPGGLHAWNIVQIDGNWYHIDSTNDAPIQDKYKFFNVTDSFLEKMGYTWERADFPKATTVYDPNTTTTVPTTPTTTTVPTTNDTLLKNAIMAVENTEKYPSYSYIEKAMIEVNKLQDSPEKTELIERLEAVKVVLLVKNAKVAVENAERYPSPSSIEKAMIEIDKLPDGEEKLGFISRIADLSSQYLITNAINAVTNAEKYKTESYIAKAIAEVSKLPESEEKLALMTRIVNLKSQMLVSVATTAVINAEKYKTVSYIEKAILEVGKLPASDVKTSLTTRIEAVKRNMLFTTATNSVVNAERFKTQSYVDKAQIDINKLPESTDKTKLIARLNVVKDNLYAIQVQTAKKYVEIAEKNKTAYSINTARIKVNTLKDGEVKTALLNRINSIKK